MSQEYLLKLVNKFLKHIKLNKIELIADFDDKINIYYNLPTPKHVYNYFENSGIAGNSITTVFEETSGVCWLFRMETPKISKNSILIIMSGNLSETMKMFHSVSHDTSI